MIWRFERRAKTVHPIRVLLRARAQSRYPGRISSSHYVYALNFFREFRKRKINGTRLRSARCIGAASAIKSLAEVKTAM